MHTYSSELKFVEIAGVWINVYRLGAFGENWNGTTFVTVDGWTHNLDIRIEEFVKELKSKISLK